MNTISKSNLDVVDIILVQADQICDQPDILNYLLIDGNNFDLEIIRINFTLRKK